MSNTEFARLFEESLKTFSMVPGTLVTGEVIEITNDYVVVNAGLKSESVIPVEQFKNAQGELEVKIGDEVEVILEAVENGNGETRLSREKAKRAEVWKDLERAFTEATTIVGFVSGKVKGGFTVEINNIRAFLPGSLIDVRPTRDTSYLEGRDVEVKVIKIDAKRNNVVVSRRAVIEEESTSDRESLLDTLEEGKVVKGIVKNLTDYGAFVDLGGIDGLLHITDMAWKRVKHPNEVVTIGDEIDVVVLKFDKEKSRVSLGLKQLDEDPWKSLIQRFPVGTRISGRVTNIADYGCFVEIEDGIEGLVHVSEMDWTNKNIHPSKIVQLGDKIDVMVLDIDAGRRRISLGVKQCINNPWLAFSQKYAKGDKVTGIIKSVTDFGLFIGLEGNIDGLVHLSDVSWDEDAEAINNQFKKGDQVEALILAVDAERERISLGIKQLSEDPLGGFLTANQKGSLVKGKVTSVTSAQVELELADGIMGTIASNELSVDKIEDAATFCKVGDELEAKIVSIDRKSMAVVLSIKAKEADDQIKMVKKYSAKAKADTSMKSTFGDLLKEHIDHRSED
ncbi:MAG: 30S ribosomal protein S1 [Gammaproteobacteria bacterium]|nr:30S ribosomal protein S1 [Gammaproteobacteria bacterium]